MEDYDVGPLGSQFVDRFLEEFNNIIKGKTQISIINGRINCLNVMNIIQAANFINPSIQTNTIKQCPSNLRSNRTLGFSIFHFNQRVQRRRTNF